MRLTLVGKLAVFIIIASIVYALWNYFAPASAREQLQRTVQGLRRGGGDGGQGTGDSRPPTPGGASTTPASPAASAGAGEILFVSTSAKKAWVEAQVRKFQEAHPERRVVVRDVPSRDAMQDVLNGKVRPTLWSPGETVWPARLAQAWRGRYSSSILDTSNPNAYRVILRSPLIFVTTRRKAEFLRPLLGSTRPWAALRELSLGKRKPPWGRFRFSHADPVTSSSGMLTFALILNEFNAEGRDPIEVARSPEFVRHLRELERSLVYDKPARDGTTALARAYLADKTRYDVITAYESHALDALSANPGLAVIYPNPTAFSDHALVLLNGDWVTSEQREGAQAFLEFLSGDEAQADAVKFGFRPGSGASSLLGERLSGLRAHGFKPNVPAIDLPPYAALNDAAYLFINRIAPALARS